MICADFSVRGFLGIKNTMVKVKMWKRHKSINYRQENASISCLVSKAGSDSIFDFTVVFRIPRNPHATILKKRHESINYRQENTGTSCLPSKAGGDDIFDFTIVFCIPGNPHPEKTA